MNSIDKNICEEIILSEYNLVQKDILDSEIIIYQYIGTFTQKILISSISAIENHMIGSTIPIITQKRLVHIAIESIQNIIHHSYKHLGKSQLAYIVISKKNAGYCINISNIIESIKIQSLANRIDPLLKAKENILPTLVNQKLENSKINENKLGGLGLLTMINKSNKKFSYKTSTMTSKHSLLQIEIKT